jgi:AcrR family transcriptional regulator
MDARYCAIKSMARTYTLKRRAEQQAETRQRIVEAAMDLHGSVGPSRTTFSMVAEKAGVQRHTLYAHFPDERSLLMACSGLSMERHPLPDAAPWREIENRRERLRTGLSEIYRWYERNAAIAACVMRDREFYQPVQEISALRYGPHFHAYHDVLGATLNETQRAMLHLAVTFATWRALVRESGLTTAAAVDAMVHAIDGTA